MESTKIRIPTVFKMVYHFTNKKESLTEGNILTLERD